jgi:hypothetical protein
MAIVPNKRVLITLCVVVIVCVWGLLWLTSALSWHSLYHSTSSDPSSEELDAVAALVASLRGSDTLSTHEDGSLANLAQELLLLERTRSKVMTKILDILPRETSGGIAGKVKEQIWRYGVVNVTAKPAGNLNALSLVGSNATLNTTEVPPRIQQYIPPFIHQTWKTKDLPLWAESSSRSWQLKNPSYQYFLYDDKDLEAYILTHHPEFKKVILKMKPIHKADLFRYIILLDKVCRTVLQSSFSC